MPPQNNTREEAAGQHATEPLHVSSSRSTEEDGPAEEDHAVPPPSSGLTTERNDNLNDLSENSTEVPLPQDRELSAEEVLQASLDFEQSHLSQSTLNRALYPSVECVEDVADEATSRLERYITRASKSEKEEEKHEIPNLGSPMHATRNFLSRGEEESLSESSDRVFPSKYHRYEATRDERADISEEHLEEEKQEIPDLTSNPMYAANEAAAILESSPAQLVQDPYEPATTRVQYCSSAEESKEEEKEEIPDLAGTPMYSAMDILPTEEATVLESSPGRLSEGRLYELAAAEDEELLAMKRAAYGGSSSSSDIHEPAPVPLHEENMGEYYIRTRIYWAGLAEVSMSQNGLTPSHRELNDESLKLATEYFEAIRPSGQEEATVVAISEDSVHPSDIATDAVHAELIGEDFSRSVALPTGEQSPSSAYASEAEQVDETTEAEVIDSAPIDLEGEEWKYTEEAQVLEEDTSGPPVDRKMPAADDDEAGSSSNFAVADQEAEVVGIQEEIHPAELDETDAEAELVGADFNYVSPAAGAPAVVEAPTDDDTPIREAAVIAESVTSRERATGSEEQEVRATLVDKDLAGSSGSWRAPDPSEPFSNPFADDSNDTPASSGAGLAALDGQYDNSWMETPVGTDNSRTPVPPPSERRSDQENTNNTATEGDDDAVPDWLRESPPDRRAFGDSGNQTSNSGTSASGRTESGNRMGLHSLSNNLARSTSQMMEVLFGDTKPAFVSRRSRTSSGDAAGSILPRTLLPWSVIYSESTKMWVATLQTNQKALDSNNVSEASKSLRAFSLPTESQALCLARSWTPPRMHPFADNPVCHICQSRFAMFRRACHCRNCGVCVCKECTTQWPAKMIPETYNLKREASVNICKACDWLCNAFRLALLEGNQDKAVALHATGNINVTSPFANVKGELFYPVHCAVLGGNLELLMWLVEEHCCPIKSVRVSGKTSDAPGKYTPIVTSKGRSLLGIAMEKVYVHIVRYLVVKKGISISGEKDITGEMLLRTLAAALPLMPDITEGSASAPTESNETSAPYSDAESPVGDFNGMAPILPSQEGFAEIPGEGRSLSEEAQAFGAVFHSRDAEGDTSGGDHKDECIICFDGKIDCVATPCGHQICCLRCSQNISRCPVCSADCSYMRVFKP